MRRDDYRIDVSGVDWVDDGGAPTQPTLRIGYAGEPERLEETLTGADGAVHDGDQLDVWFRLRGALDEDGATGVVGVTDRLTGDFVLEANADAETVLRFVRAVREYGTAADEEDGRYVVTIEADDEELVTDEKGTLLVYNGDGDLLRERSLIPGGVEL